MNFELSFNNLYKTQIAQQVVSQFPGVQKVQQPVAQLTTEPKGQQPVDQMLPTIEQIEAELGGEQA